MRVLLSFLALVTLLAVAYTFTVLVWWQALLVWLLIGIGYALIVGLVLALEAAQP